VGTTRLLDAQLTSRSQGANDGRMKSGTGGASSNLETLADERVMDEPE
jgi:hypothetical protein